MAQKVERQLSIYINGTEVNRSLKSIGGEISKLRNKQRKLTAGTDEWIDTTKELKKARNEYKLVNDEIREVEASLDDTTDSSENFFSSLTGMFQALKNGDLDGAKAGLDGVKNSIKGATKQALAFIATPIGAAIAALAGIAIAGKAWLDYNEQVNAALKTTQQITQLSGDQAQEARIRAQSLADTFENTNLKENLETARSLVENYGISYNAAFDVIEGNLVRGQDNNDEYFKSLREYSTFFSSAGFSATEFGDIISAGYDLGFYDDKLPDAIKEADLALREQTTSTRDALENAFGAGFTDDILSRVKTGEITTKTALEEIAQKATKEGVNIQAAAQLTADLFKGAGEDAGGALKIFETVETAVNGVKRELTEAEQVTQDQIDTNKALEATFTSLFAAGEGGFSNITAKAKLFITQGLLKIVTGVVNVINYFRQLNNDSAVFSGIVTSIGEVFKINFRIIGVLIDNVSVAFSGLGDIISGVFTLDSDKIAAGFIKTQAATSSIINDIKKEAIEAGNNISEAFAGNNKVDLLEVSSFTSGDEKTKDGKTPEEIAAEKLAKEEAIKAAEARKKTAEDLAEFIKAKRKELQDNQLTGIEKELAAIDDKYAKEEERAKNHGDKLKEIEILKDQEKQAAKDALSLEYAQKTRELEAQIELENEQLRLEKEAQDAVTEEEKLMLMADKAFQLAQAEIEREREKELAKVEVVDGAEELKHAIREKYAQKEDQLNKIRNEAYSDAKETQSKINEQTVQQDLKTVANGLGQAASLFNQGSEAWKASKIAEAVIMGYQSALASYNAGAKVGGPIVGGVFAGISAAATFKQINDIRKTDIPKQKKPKLNSKFYGGYTESTPISDDQYGGATGYYHADEWVSPAWMTQSPRYANTISWLENERKQGPSYTTDTTASSTVTSTSSSSTDGSVMTEIRDLLKGGVIAKTYFGYEEIEKFNKLNEDITQSQNNLTP